MGTGSSPRLASQSARKRDLAVGCAEPAFGVRGGSLSEVDLEPAALAEVLERDPLRCAIEHRGEELLVGLLETSIVEAEPGGQQTEHLGVGLRLAERRDRRLVVGDVVVPPREQQSRRSSCVVTGSTTSAWRAVSVMNSSSTTVNRSSRSEPGQNA